MKQLIRYFVLSISLAVFLFPKKTAMACGFYVYPGEYRFWLLQPNLTNEIDLSPFYFASTYMYGNDMYKRVEPYPEQNIEEWFSELKGKVPKKDIDDLLNETIPDIYFNQKDSLFKKNAFYRFLQQPQNRELSRYFTISKKAEQMGMNPDPWEESEHRSSGTMNQLISEAKALHAEAGTPFVKLRSGFQIIRLYNYSGKPELLSQFYDRYIAHTKTDSWIKTAALYQKAITSGEYESDYLLSKVFDIGGYNRTECLVKFDHKVTDSTLLFAKNKHERTVIYAMKAFNYPGRNLSLIRHIFREEPGYKELPFLLLREINKLEDWLLTTKLTDFDSPGGYGTNWNYYWEKENDVANRKLDKAYAKEMADFLEEAIGKSSNQNKTLLHLYAAHLGLLRKDYASGWRHLQEAKSAPSNSKTIQTQVSINEFLLQLEKGFDETAENRFMAILGKSDKELAITDPDIMRSQLVLYTARKMISQGSRAKGLLLLSRTNRALGELPIDDYKKLYQVIEETADDHDYDEMLQILGKKEKSSFEKFISIKKFQKPIDSYGEYYGERKTHEWSEARLLDCKASWYLRKHRLQDAMNTVDKIPDSFYHTYPYDTKLIDGNPFYVNIYDPHKVTIADKRWLNKKEIIASMKELERLAITRADKAAESYYQLANSWYNMTYHGKNWLMVRQWWSIHEMNKDDPYSKPSAFNADYYGCSYARSMYVKALESTNDKKLAALCMLMISKCDENNQSYHWALTDHVYHESDDKAAKRRNRDQAKRRGVDLGFFDSLIKECELYQSFIAQYNRKL